MQPKSRCHPLDPRVAQSPSSWHDPRRVRSVGTRCPIRSQYVDRAHDDRPAESARVGHPPGLCLRVRGGSERGRGSGTGREAARAHGRVEGRAGCGTGGVQGEGIPGAREAGRLHPVGHRRFGAEPNHWISTGAIRTIASRWTKAHSRTSRQRVLDGAARRTVGRTSAGSRAKDPAHGAR